MSSTDRKSSTAKNDGSVCGSTKRAKYRRASIVASTGSLSRANSFDAFSIVDVPPLHRCHASRRVTDRELVALRGNGDVVHVDPAARSALLETEIVELNRYITEARSAGAQFYAAADVNRRKHNLVSWTTTAIMALTSGGSTLYNFFVAQAIAESDSQYAYRIVLNILLVIVTLLKGWQQTYRPEWKAMNYEMTADDFMNFAREWRLRLAQGVDDRRDRVALALVSAQHVLHEIELSAMPLKTHK